MYVPPHFREDRPEVLADAITGIGFATLVTQNAEGITANALPLILAEEGRVLRGHFARANPVWQSLKPDAEALAIFMGPHAYVSPGWYPSKAETGKAVPTWNYITVQARGPITLQQSPDWLRAHVAALSARHESPRPEPWTLEDAPAGYIETMLRAIIGFEIAITRLEDKWKLSQNRSAADIEGVRAACAREGRDDMAKLMS